MQLLDWITISLYITCLVSLVLYVRRAKRLEDYAVASRSLPTAIITATLAATFIGPGYAMGLAGKASAGGYIWVIIFSAFAVQTIIVGLFIAPGIQRCTGARTIPEIIGGLYGPAARTVTAMITIALLIGFVGVISRAAAELISSFTGLSLSKTAVITCAIVIAYSTFGGIKADILLDILHFGLLSVGVPILLWFTFSQSTTWEHLPTLAENASKTFTSLSTLEIIGGIAGFFLGEALIPPYVTRALASRSPRTARRGFVFAGLFGLAWFFVCAAIGIIVAGSSPQNAGDGAFIYAMNTYLPAGLYGLVLAALMGIILSSWDSLLNCASVSFTVDIVQIFYKDELPMRVSLVLTKMLTVVIGILAILFALAVPGIVDALMYCYTLWAPTVVLPLAFGIVLTKVNPYAGLAAILTGGIATAVWEWALDVPYEIPSLLVGVLCNQIAFWSMNLFGPPRPERGLFAPTTLHLREVK